MELGEEDKTRSADPMMEPDFAGSGAVRPAHAIDVGRLADWLGAHVFGYVGPLAIEQFKGGQSNPTYKLKTSKRTYVLRRKPPGPILKGAHAIEREARVLTALGRQGFAVPHVHAVCEDPRVIGTPFYVMDMVEGRIFWDPTLPEVPRANRAPIFDAMNATIAQLHGFDPEAIGLGDYGKPGNYFERQIARWSRQYLQDEIAGRDANMERLVDWLPAHIPMGEEAAIVHGDFRLDNMIFHPTEPRIVAVLDWELSTLGHPLSDFAYNLMLYRMPQFTIAGLAGQDLAKLGLPSEADYVAAYCRRTGRDGIPDLGFYLAFNLFRFAAIIHGIKGRLARGNAASDHAESLVSDFAAVAALGWLQTRSDN